MFVSPPDGEKDSVQQGAKRRSVLKGVGALGATGLLSSLAGCTGGGGGPGEDRKTPELELLSYTQDQKQIYNTLKMISDRMSEELGFDMTFTPVNRDRQLTKVYTERDYDISSLGYTGRPHRLDPHMLMYKNYHSSQTRAGSYGWTGLQNDEVDAILDKQAEEMDRTKRQEYVKEAQKVIMDLPGGEIPIEHNNLINVINTRDFEGWQNTAGLGFKNIWTWTGVTPTGDKTTLNAAYTIAANQISPLVAGEANLITGRMTHDKLMRIDTDGLPTPWLAEDYELSDDNLTVTFTLREDLPDWHDGEPMTADDIAFTFNYLREWETPFFADAILPLKPDGATVVDDRTVTIELERTFAPVFVLTFSRVHILPEHIWSKVPEETDVDRPYLWNPTNSDVGYVGSGPFKFDHWRKAEEIGVVANPDHFAAPNVDAVNIRILPSSSAQTTALKSGEVDFLIQTGANPQVMKDLADEEDHLEFRAVRSVGYDELALNTRRPPLDDPTVRGAIASIIPKDTIVNELFDGFAEVALSPTAPVLEFWHNPDVKKWHEIGPEGAREMLEEAGYVIEDDTLYFPEGEVPTGDTKPVGPPE